MAPSRLEAKEQEDMEEVTKEAQAEEVEVDEMMMEANHSTWILSLSATAMVSTVDPIPTLTVVTADPYQHVEKAQQLILLPQ